MNNVESKRELLILKRRFERLIDEIKLSAPSIIIKMELRLIIESCKSINSTLD